MNIWIIGLAFLYFLGLLFLIWISGFIFGAPFEPSHGKEARAMLELSKAKKGDQVAELGAGDGKMVIEFAKKGAEVHGYEINPFLVWVAKKRIKEKGLQDKAEIHWKNFWKQNLGSFDVVSVFQINLIMRRLEKKLKKELKKGARVVSNTWKLPNKKQVKQKDNVYLYEF